jgi:hypothetical protein
LPEPYVLVPSSKLELDKVRFVGRSGEVFESPSPIILEEPFGHTLRISDQTIDGAQVTVEVDRVSP